MSSDLEGDINGDGIIDEMDRVRNDLGGEIDQLGEGMRSMFDWQAYVRSAPLTSAAAAVLVGFLIAPRLGSRTPVVVDPNSGSPFGSAGPSSVPKMIKTMLFSGLAQAGSAYLADFLSRYVNQSPSNPAEDTEPPESAQPF